MHDSLWQQCLALLEHEVPEKQFITWIRPLHAVADNGLLKLLAPNRFVLDWVQDHYLANIRQAVKAVLPDERLQVTLEVGSVQPAQEIVEAHRNATAAQPAERRRKPRNGSGSSLNADFTFDTFVEGKSNQLARAASMQIAENPGEAYNPLFIYGGVGLEKLI